MREFKNPLSENTTQIERTFVCSLTKTRNLKCSIMKEEIFIANKIMHIKYELVFLVDCGMDAEMACGEGAVNCTIQANNNVRCECGTGYHLSDDLHSCVIGKYMKLC